MNNMNPTIEQNQGSEQLKPSFNTEKTVAPYVEGEPVSGIIPVTGEKSVNPVKEVPTSEVFSLIGSGYEIGEIGQFTGKGENLSDTARNALKSKITGEAPQVD